MNHTLKYTAIVALCSLSLACGSSAKEEKGSLTDQKTTLQELKKQQSSLNDKIAALEADIAAKDTSGNTPNTAKLVGITALEAQQFTHYIDLQGKIDAENISAITPRQGGGQVKAIYVKEGDQVRKGQLLIKLDDAIIRQQVVAAQQSLETLKTQLSFAKDIYTRQSNLWKQDIGTEVQLINARNNVQTLETQLRSSQENIKTLQEQQAAFNVYSDVSGVADIVNVRVGEIFTGFAGASPQIQIVNKNALKVVTDVPENYASKVRNGSAVVINLPDLGKSFNSTISRASQTVNNNNRSFIAEAKLPFDANMRPNQIAQVQIKDYEVASTIVIPVNTMQTDDKGKYVFVAVKEGNQWIARKKVIVAGEMYKDKIEVKSGLQAGDQLITEGYQTVYDGQKLRTAL
jgi:membrane fusion protein, multidrug efflux system